MYLTMWHAIFIKITTLCLKKEYAAKHPGSSIEIQQSHGGSSKQALAVANGLQADVVTMNQLSDIELLADKGLVAQTGAERLPDHAVPFTSTTVFLVRKGNPQQVRDWADLTKENLKIVIANPKTTGNGRYAFLGAYGYALKANNGDEARANDFTRKLLANVPVYENGGRAATTTFTQRNIGDVLITFENEANYVSRVLSPDQFEIVYPSYTILSESPVAVVDNVVEKKPPAKRPPNISNIYGASLRKNWPRSFICARAMPKCSPHTLPISPKSTPSAPTIFRQLAGNHEEILRRRRLGRPALT